MKLICVEIIIIFLSSISQIISTQSSYYQYYDLNSDPYETNNLYGNAVILKNFTSMQTNGKKWLSQVGNLQVAGKM